MRNLRVIIFSIFIALTFCVPQTCLHASASEATVRKWHKEAHKIIKCAREARDREGNYAMFMVLESNNIIFEPDFIFAGNAPSNFSFSCAGHSYPLRGLNRSFQNFKAKNQEDYEKFLMQIVDLNYNQRLIDLSKEALEKQIGETSTIDYLSQKIEIITQSTNFEKLQEMKISEQPIFSTEKFTEIKNSLLTTESISDAEKYLEGEIEKILENIQNSELSTKEQSISSTLVKRVLENLSDIVKSFFTRKEQNEKKLSSLTDKDYYSHYLANFHYESEKAILYFLHQEKETLFADQSQYEIHIAAEKDPCLDCLPFLKAFVTKFQGKFIVVYSSQKNIELQGQYRFLSPGSNPDLFEKYKEEMPDHEQIIRYKIVYDTKQNKLILEAQGKM